MSMGVTRESRLTRTTLLKTKAACILWPKELVDAMQLRSRTDKVFSTREETVREAIGQDGGKALEGREVDICRRMVNGLGGGGAGENLTGSHLTNEDGEILNAVKILTTL